MFNTQTGYELYDSLLVCGDSGTWYAGAKLLTERKMPDCVRKSIDVIVFCCRYSCYKAFNVDL